MAGGTVTQTWSGSYSRDPVVYVAGPPPLAPLAVPVANTAGQWLFALVSWRQDAGTAGTLTYPSTVTISDDAGNFWIPAEVVTPQTGIVRCAVWMAPAARQAEFVFASPTAYQSAITVLIVEVTADCPWYAVQAQAQVSANQGTSITLSQDPASGFFSLGMIAYDNESASVSVTATGWTALPGFSTVNGTDSTGDLVQDAWHLTSSGSTQTISASSGTTMDWAEVIVAVSGVTNVLPFPYSLPLENWPVLITEIAAGPVLNSNPLILSGTTDWTGTNATVAEVTWPVWNPWPSYQAMITPSLSVTPSGSAASASVASGTYAVTSSVRYEGLAYVYSQAGYSSCSAGIAWYTSGLSLISTTQGTAVDVLAGTWTQLGFPAGVFPPATAAFGKVVVTETAASGDVPSSAVLYVGYAALGVSDAYENVPPDEIAWTDVSSRNYTHESVTVSRGIQYEQQSLEAGTMAVTLASDDAAWTFGNIESAYWPNAGDTDVPVRLRAVWPGSITPYYPLFSGFTDDIGFGWDEDWYGYARVEAADCWSRLTQQLLGCAEQEVLEDSPAGYWTCSLAGTNTAVDGTAPVATADSPFGTSAGVAVFTSTAISLPGDPGVSCWQSAGMTAGDAGGLGVALAYQPGAGTPAIPPVAGGVTIEFWFQPVAVSADQPTADLTVCTCWGSRGPLWTLYIDNLAGSGSSNIYVVTYDKATGAGTSTKLGTSTYLGADSAITTSYCAVTFTQSAWDIALNFAGSGGGFYTGSVSANLGAEATGFSWGGNVSPAGVSAANPDGSYGFMNLAVYGIALYEGIVPAARLTSHYQGGQTAFASELDSWRLARIAGYSGFVPVLGMRCMDLAVPPGADLDIVTGATDTSGQVVSAYFTNIAASTLAAMFTDGAGTLIYRRRLEWYDRPVPQWAAGEGGTALALTGVAINSNTLNQGPSLTGWTAGNGATLTSSGISGVNPLFYPYCALFHGNGSTASPQIVYGSVANTPVTAGAWYALSCWVYSPQGYAGGFTASLRWMTSGAVQVGSDQDYVVPALSAGSLTFLQGMAVQAPTTAAYALLVLHAAGTPASTVLFYVTDAALVQVPVVAAGGDGATATEAPYLDSAKLSSDRAQLYNQAVLTQYGTNLVSSFSGTGVLFTPSSGVVVLIQNTPSITLRGAVPYTVTLYLNNTAQALPYYLDQPSMEDFGNWVTQTLGQPLFRPLSITLTPAATPQALAMGLGAEVGDTATFRRRQLGTPETQIVTYASKLSHEIDIAEDPPRWDVKYELSPLPQASTLACDDVVHGCLTGGNLLGW